MEQARRKRVFISSVSDEFGSYRESLAKRLARISFMVTSQKNFGTLGSTTLQKLHNHIHDCDAVVHLVGDAAGAAPPIAAIRSLLNRCPDLLHRFADLKSATDQELEEITYTQWEAYIAIYYKIDVLIYRPSEGVQRNKKYRDYEIARKSREKSLQSRHFMRLKGLGSDRGSFSSSTKLGDVVIEDLNNAYRPKGEFNLPQLPDHYVEIPGRIQEAIDKLLAATGTMVGVTSSDIEAKRKLGIQGMGGIGKTVLATAVANDPRVRGYFDHHVIWIKLGQNVSEADLKSHQASVYKYLRGQERSFESLQQGKIELGNCFKEVQALLVLDDVWQAEHVTLFNVQPFSRLLFTTQQARIIRQLSGVQQQTLDVLTVDDALSLLASAASTTKTELPEDAIQIVQLCGCLPLALALAGRMVKEVSWKYVLNQLISVDLEKLESYFDDYPHPNLLRALQASVDCLRPELKDRYLDFAVFPHDVLIPESTIELLWKTEDVNQNFTEWGRSELLQRALLQRGAKSGFLTLHYLQLQHLKAQQDPQSIRRLHERLLSGYESICDDRVGWASGPVDGYFFEQLPYHLCQAGQQKVLRELLRNYDWLLAKLQACGIARLLGDFDTYFESVGDSAELRLIAETIRLSADVLMVDPSQLAVQLLGRLMSLPHQEDVELLLSQARNACVAPVLVPLKGNLTPPGGPLIRTLRGHTEGVNSIAACLDAGNSNPIVVSVSDDGTLRTWDLATGDERQSFPGNSEALLDVAVASDGRMAVFGSRKREVQIWDLKQGVCRQILTGHQGWVRSVAISNDGRWIVSGSSDGSIRVWDAVTGEMIRTITGHSGPVVDLEISADGRLIYSASHDWSAALWDLETGKRVHSLLGHRHRCVWGIAVASTSDRLVTACGDHVLRVWNLSATTAATELQGHYGAIYCVTISPDGKRAVSGSEDRTLRVWDLEAGTLITTLRGHHGPVTRAALTPDGDFVLSASGDSQTSKGDKTIRVWSLKNIPDGRPQAQHSGAIRTLVVTNDQRAILSGSQDKSLKVWDLNRNQVISTLYGHHEGVRTVSISQDGSKAISGSDDSTIKIWNLQDFSLMKTLTGHESGITSIVLAPDEDTIVSGSEDRTIRVWSLKGNCELTRYYADAPILACAISPDGSTVIAGDSEDNLHFLKLTLVERSFSKSARQHRRKPIDNPAVTD